MLPAMKLCVRANPMECSPTATPAAAPVASAAARPRECQHQRRHQYPHASNVTRCERAYPT
eukprot:5030041-Karenia_brevis.AAC.1